MKPQIPKYKTNIFNRKMHPYCLCIFVLDEGLKFQDQMMKLSPYVNDVDIIIADGGSTDGSINHSFLRKYNVSALLVKMGRGGLSSQMRIAFHYILSKRYQGIIVMDGNNKDDPSAIPLFVDSLKNGFDHVQGSRFVKGGKAINTPLLRYIGIRFIHAPLISMASKFRYTDTTNGFRAYSSRMLLDDKINVFRDVFSKYELHYYLSIRSSQLGYRIKEIPTIREYPAKEKTPTKISPIKGNITILMTLFKSVFNRYNP